MILTKPEHITERKMDENTLLKCILCKKEKALRKWMSHTMYMYERHCFFEKHQSCKEKT